MGKCVQTFDWYCWNNCDDLTVMCGTGVLPHLPPLLNDSSFPPRLLVASDQVLNTLHVPATVLALQQVHLKNTPPQEGVNKHALEYTVVCPSFLEAELRLL